MFLFVNAICALPTKSVFIPALSELLIYKT